MTNDMDSRADNYGYVRYRCPRCHRLFWSDSGPNGNCPCGYEEETEEINEEEEESHKRALDSNGEMQYRCYQHRRTI